MLRTRLMTVCQRSRRGVVENCLDGGRRVDSQLAYAQGLVEYVLLVNARIIDPEVVIECVVLKYWASALFPVVRQC